jgi:predicted RNase H-like HicB family nuclease
METTLTVLLTPAGEGWFTATVAEVPEAISEGLGEEEAVKNALLAVKEVFEHRRGRLKSDDTVILHSSKLVVA